MRLTARLCLAATVLATMTGCPESQAGPLALPKWESLGNAGIDERDFTPRSIAAGDKGFVLAGDLGAQGRAYYSADGRTWTRTDAGQNGWLEVGGDGRAVYALWSERTRSRLVVRRYAGAGRWDDPIGLNLSIPLDGVGFGVHTNWAIAGGAEGVHVAYHAYDGRVQLWSSRDGRTFTSTVVTLAEYPLPVAKAAAVSTPIGTAVVSVSIGQVTRLAAVGSWPAEVLSEVPENSYVDFVAINGDHLSLHGTMMHRKKEGDPGFVEGEDPLGDNDTYTGVGQCATRSSPRLANGTVDPGKLPDLGVSTTYLPEAVVAYRSGFLMVGRTLSDLDGGDGIGGVWISDDGCAWRKDQVRSNGFGEVGQLVGVATRDGVTVLVGIEVTDGVAAPAIWRG